MTEEGEAELIPNPFLVFAEETWEHILSNVEDSRDILNVFQAYPDLEGRVMKNKYAWLIDQVYEHLSPWLPREDELVCRQVSQRWARAVDTDMEKYHFPIQFQKTDEMTSFLQKMCSHPPSRTPFVGRSAMIDDPGPDFEAIDYDQTLFWTGAKDIFRRFGGHISFLNLRSHGFENTLQFCQIVLEVLRSVPNLKSLELSQYDGDGSEEADEFVAGQISYFPVLPQLERMGFTGNYDSTPELLIVHLLRQYSPQIRKLGIHLYHWREEYSNLFPKLEELNLVGDILVEDVVGLLYSLNAPELKKLWLELKAGVGGALENSIVSWLEDFPRIQELDIVIFDLGDHFEEEEVSFPIPTTTSIPTLKHLAIEGAVDDVDFTFLECFPSLQFFKVCAYDRPPKYFEGRNLYEPEIWEMLPKLEDFYISKRELPGLPKYFTRAKYEWLKERKERRMEGPPDVECLIHSFDSMVSDNWEGDNGEGDVHGERDVENKELVQVTGWTINTSEYYVI